MNLWRIGITTAALVAAVSVQARAAIITVYDRATFQAAVGSGTITQQNFDALAAGTTLGTLACVTYSASTGQPLVTNSFYTTTAPNGLGRTGAGFFLNTDTATFAFASAIGAFGIDINTFAPNAGAYTATLNLGDTVLSRFDAFPGLGTGQFLGFTSDTPFTSVTISTNSAFAYTLDTLVYGNTSAIVPLPVPEPATLLLFATGLAAGAGRRLRRRT